MAQADIRTHEIEYTNNSIKLKGYLAYDDAIQGKRPGILVVHEWWGHNEHARGRTRMLAEDGYTALAVDMYGNGKVAEHPKDAGAFSSSIMRDFETNKERFLRACGALLGTPIPLNHVFLCF